MIQSTVGDAMTEALINLYNYRKIVNEPDMYRILLSIHDAVLLEVPVENVARVEEEVLPTCMVEAVQIPGFSVKYTLGDSDISVRWGETTPPEELEARGVPRKYCGYKE